MKAFVFLAALLTASSAFAGTYARVSAGQALDVITGANLTAALSGRFVAGYNPQPYWTQVPDTDTNGAALKSGAHDNGNGTFTNPAAPAPVMVDASLSKSAFQALLAANGNDLTAALAAWPKVAQ